MVPDTRQRKNKLSDVKPIKLIYLELLSNPSGSSFELHLHAAWSQVVVGVDRTQHHIFTDTHVAQGKLFCIALRTCHFHTLHEPTWVPVLRSNVVNLLIWQSVCKFQFVSRLCGQMMFKGNTVPISWRDLDQAIIPWLGVGIEPSRYHYTQVCSERSHMTGNTVCGNSSVEPNSHEGYHFCKTLDCKQLPIEF